MRPLNLLMRLFFKRLEDFYGGQEVNSYRNCHQRTNIPNGVRTFSVVLNRYFPVTLRFGPFQVRLFHRHHTQRHHICNRCRHFTRECPNGVCFNCDNLGHISKESPHSPRCCICKSLDHLAIDCEFSRRSPLNSSRVSSCRNGSITREF